ncbi:MAG TPA: DUF1080 domain-containing protein [Planctomycetota bacterium]|jgi:hypothetical protein|nr:DUF1080 domain-containing protein [Planctomycetota bacterium]OQC19215.1 MAG: hypothetical protein BWX69_02914 [Planctomycetes bacterium ADurb.Bin069]HNS00330.1 DUF1080 domain-containing protein [Planctomycetota bacterium]HNU27336.1 DUF1080 domain-containing protein [Planctomycetota bacterium]HOE31127.1 DUF1080 domain-containing protein [Planctomycetota bacterium]
MRQLAASSLAALLICVTAGAAEPPAAPPQGFTALFNGVNLDGWYGHGTQDPRVLWAMTPEALAAHKEKTRANLRAHWRVDGGVLVNDGEGLYATTDKDYGDFELLVEYKTVAKADSGIYLRAVPQVQIWDYTKEGGKWNLGADKGSGGLWNNSPGAPGKDPLVLADKPFGEWNALRIVMVGERVTVFLNGKRVVDHARLENYFDRKLPVFRKGPIQLQTHGGEIRWRNIFLREIPAEEACAILRAGGVDKPAADDGFAPIFNGKDWTGWKGPTAQNAIKDGAIHAQSGTIFTAEEYEDFVVRFEFTLPKGGNNGLAIRYPGAGDTAYVGMCEIQVLDNEDPEYAALDPRQYHGSAYGMAAAHRGYLRAPGEWNFQCVTVKGSTIVVELNGTRILDTDLAKITKAMYDLDKFKGRNRTKGSFGFAGHGQPVKFRGIELKRL